MAHIRHAELAPGLYKITLVPDNCFVSFNHFLLLGQQDALLVHAGHQQHHALLKQQVDLLLGSRRLCSIFFSHLEADESGALTQWVAEYPDVKVLVGKVGASNLADFLPDFAIQRLKDEASIAMPPFCFRFLETPHFPHNWDACLLYEETTRTLFASDLGTQAGDATVEVAGPELVPTIMTLQERVGYLSYSVDALKQIKRLQAMSVHTLAAMHGACLDEDGAMLLLSSLKSVTINELQKALLND